MTFSYKVFAKIDEKGNITQINSSAFIPESDLTNWTEIDEGYGLSYHHAQNNYLPGPLRDYRGIPRYKLVDGKAQERTTEEIEADYTPPEVEPTAEELLGALMEGIANA